MIVFCSFALNPDLAAVDVCSNLISVLVFLLIILQFGLCNQILMLGSVMHVAFLGHDQSQPLYS